jgi:hypothetical protein
MAEQLSNFFVGRSHKGTLENQANSAIKNRKPTETEDSPLMGLVLFFFGEFLHERVVSFLTNRINRLI